MSTVAEVLRDLSRSIRLQVSEASKFREANDQRLESIEDSLKTISKSLDKLNQVQSLCEKRIESINQETGRVANSLSIVSSIATSKLAYTIYGGIMAATFWAITTAMGMPWSLILRFFGINVTGVM